MFDIRYAETIEAINPVYAVISGCLVWLFQINANTYLLLAMCTRAYVCTYMSNIEYRISILLACRYAFPMGPHPVSPLPSSSRSEISFFTDAMKYACEQFHCNFARKTERVVIIPQHKNTRAKLLSTPRVAGERFAAIVKCKLAEWRELSRVVDRSKDPTVQRTYSRRSHIYAPATFIRHSSTFIDYSARAIWGAD